jgi:hypothetical protein
MRLRTPLHVGHDRDVTKKQRGERQALAAYCLISLSTRFMPRAGLEPARP